MQMLLMHQETYFVTIFKRLRDLRLHQAILLQAKAAAPLYAQALCEMVRRREFAERYLSWANGVVETSLACYESEVSTRNKVVEKLGEFFPCDGEQQRR